MLIITSFERFDSIGFIRMSVSFFLEDEPDEKFKYMLGPLQEFHQLITFEQAEYTVKRKKQFVVGANMISIEEDGSYLFSEYFTRCPIVETMISEIYLMSMDDSYGCERIARESYFFNTLESLSKFWD